MFNFKKLLLPLGLGILALAFHSQAPEMTESNQGLVSNGIGWNGIHWNALGVNGMDWNGMDWNGLHLNGDTVNRFVVHSHPDWINPVTTMTTLNRETVETILLEDGQLSLRLEN